MITTDNIQVLSPAEQERKKFHVKSEVGTIRPYFRVLKRIGLIQISIRFSISNNKSCEKYVFL